MKNNFFNIVVVAKQYYRKYIWCSSFKTLVFPIEDTGGPH